MNATILVVIAFFLSRVVRDSVGRGVWVFEAPAKETEPVPRVSRGQVVDTGEPSILGEEPNAARERVQTTVQAA